MFIPAQLLAFVCVSLRIVQGDFGWTLVMLNYYCWTPAEDILCSQRVCCIWAQNKKGWALCNVAKQRNVCRAGRDCNRSATKKSLTFDLSTRCAGFHSSCSPFRRTTLWPLSFWAGISLHFRLCQFDLFNYSYYLHTLCKQPQKGNVHAYGNAIRGR